MIPVIFKNFDPASPAIGYWDQTLLTKMFEKDPFIILEDLREARNAIVVVPGSQNIGYIPEINRFIGKLKGVVLIITGNEGGRFDVSKILHPNMKLWYMIPHEWGKYDNVDRFFGFNITPHCKYLPDELPNKDLRWFFAGQMIHSRRRVAADGFEALKDGELIRTDGFAQGITRKEYMKKMARARIIPCVGAPRTPDTFRFYEALEAGCIPIVDEYSTLLRDKGYWRRVFGDDFPIPTTDSWNKFPRMLFELDRQFVSKSNEVSAWWQLYKYKFWNWLQDDFYTVAKEDRPKEGITVIIPTSPIPSHPSTEIIDQTIESVTTQLPDAKILIIIDGVRAEDEHKKENYKLYTQKLLWKCNRKGYIPLLLQDHYHQVAGMRKAFEYVRTEKMFYVEHDTPIGGDIDWKTIIKMVDDKVANYVRLHYNYKINTEHEKYMFELKPKDYPAIRTFQWSQRPHVTTKTFYMWLLEKFFSPEAKCMIEDGVFGKIAEDVKQNPDAWDKYKMWIYYPDAETIQRSFNLDGRAGAPKYAKKQIF